MVTIVNITAQKILEIEARLKINCAIKLVVTVKILSLMLKTFEKIGQLKS